MHSVKVKDQILNFFLTLFFFLSQSFCIITVDSAQAEAAATVV